MCDVVRSKYRLGVDSFVRRCCYSASSISSLLLFLFCLCFCLWGHEGVEAGGLCVLSQLLGGKPQNLSSSKAADYIDAVKLGLTFLSSSQSLEITTLVPPELTSPKTNQPTSLFCQQAIGLGAAAAPHFPLETASGPALSWSIHTGGKAPPYDALYQRAAHAQLVVPAVKAQRQLLAVHSISWARRLCFYLSSWKLDRFSNQERAVLSLQLLFLTSGTYLAR